MEREETRARCPRCVEPMTIKDRRICGLCRRWFHRKCLKPHRLHVHTKDERAPFGGRRFWKP